MIFNGQANEFLQLETFNGANNRLLDKKISSSLIILWSNSDDVRLLVDDVEYCLPKNRLVFLTEFHRVTPVQVEGMRLLRFNRSFYCIIDHDSEVSCRGILFFGAPAIPVIEITDAAAEQFELLWRMFLAEMKHRDNLQMEMLQMLLKRWLILSVRLYKNQQMPGVQAEQTELVREFNYQVEVHFKEHHDVAFYAAQLHKSPKTLANYFAANNFRSPLKVIQERLLLEARRRLQYTEKPVKEIAYELGFTDIQAFSRFFRKSQQCSPVDYRKQLTGAGTGTIAQLTGKRA